MSFLSVFVGELPLMNATKLKGKVFRCTYLVCTYVVA